MSGLRVGFDATPLASFRTGIGRAVAETEQALRALPDGPELVPYVLGLRAPQVDPAPGTRRVRCSTRLLVAGWSRGLGPRIDHWLGDVDVVHATNYVTAPSRHPTVVTVWDTFSLDRPESVSALVRRFGPMLRVAIDHGAFVHTTSEAVAERVEHHFGPGLGSSGRLVSIPLGIPDLGPLGSPGPVVDGLAGRPFVLALGSLERRKGIPVLVAAFAAITDSFPDLRLVIAGGDGNDRPAIDAAIAALPERRGRA